MSRQNRKLTPEQTRLEQTAMDRLRVHLDRVHNAKFLPLAVQVPVDKAEGLNQLIPLEDATLHTVRFAIMGSFANRGGKKEAHLASSGKLGLHYGMAVGDCSKGVKNLRERPDTRHSDGTPVLTHDDIVNPELHAEALKTWTDLVEDITQWAFCAVDAKSKRPISPDFYYKKPLLWKVMQKVDGKFVQVEFKNPNTGEIVESIRGYEQAWRHLANAARFNEVDVVKLEEDLSKQGFNMGKLKAGLDDRSKQLPVIQDGGNFKFVSYFPEKYSKDILVGSRKDTLDAIRMEQYVGVRVEAGPHSLHPLEQVFSRVTESRTNRLSKFKCPAEGCEAMHTLDEFDGPEFNKFDENGVPKDFTYTKRCGEVKTVKHVTVKMGKSFIAICPSCDKRRQYSAPIPSRTFKDYSMTFKQGFVDWIKAKGPVKVWEKLQYEGSEDVPGTLTRLHTFINGDHELNMQLPADAQVHFVPGQILVPGNVFALAVPRRESTIRNWAKGGLNAKFNNVTTLFEGHGIKGVKQVERVREVQKLWFENQARIVQHNGEELWAFPYSLINEAVMDHRLQTMGEWLDLSGAKEHFRPELGAVVYPPIRLNNWDDFQDGELQLPGGIKLDVSVADTRFDRGAQPMDSIKKETGNKRNHRPKRDRNKKDSQVSEVFGLNTDSK